MPLSLLLLLGELGQQDCEKKNELVRSISNRALTLDFLLFRVSHGDVFHSWRCTTVVKHHMLIKIEGEIDLLINTAILILLEHTGNVFNLVKM